MKDTFIDVSAIDRLLEVIGGDRNDLRELIEEFQSSTPLLLSRMVRAAADNDLDDLRIASHSLKANGRDFGAMTLATLCERLEHDCKSGAVEDPSGQVSAISRALEDARDALERILTDHE